MVPDGFAGSSDWQGSCEIIEGELGQYQDSKAYPPNSNQPDNTCLSENNGSGSGGAGSGQSSTSASEPTTSGGTEATSDEPTSPTGTTGDDETDNLYICSTQSPYKCVDLQPDNALADNPMYFDPYTDPNDPNHTIRDDCWSSVNPDAPPHHSKCVIALSELDARTKCQDDCAEYRKALIEECEGDPDCDLVNAPLPVDCELDGSYVNVSGQLINNDPGGEQPIKKSQVSNWECDGEPIMMSVGPFNQFEASATLVTPQGVSAGVGSFRGYLGYKLSACTPATCTITIDTLVQLSKRIEGGYSDATGAGGVFEVQQMGLQVTAPFSGTWNRTRKTVTFPNAVMNAQFWADAVLIDGVPVTVGYGAYTIETDQVVGTLDAIDGPLTLNVTQDMPSYGIVSLSLRTLPPT